MTDDDPITLKDAAQHHGFTVSTLKAEAARGRLTTYKIGKRLYTTPADIKEMVRQCRVERKAPGFTLILSESNGLSETDLALSAQVAARATADLLKRRLANTSPTSINQNRQVRR